MDRMTQEYLQSELSIQLGTKRNIEDLIHAIDAANCEVRDADLILAKIHLPVATSPLSVDLVICTPEELGFKNGTDFRSLCNQARKQGLDLCPPEVAFQLCLQYNHYQLGERLTIVTEGIAVSRGAMVSCQVGRDYGGRVWLGLTWENPEIICCPRRRFIFRQRLFYATKYNSAEKIEPAAHISHVGHEHHFLDNHR